MKNHHVYTLYCEGFDVSLIKVEAHIGRGLPSFQIVGLAEKAVKESRDRVKAAIYSSGFQFPNQKVLVNLAPGDLPKSGTYYDLPIAIAILLASSQLQSVIGVAPYVFAGELGLDGQVKTFATALTLAIGTMKKHMTLIGSNFLKVPKELLADEGVMGFESLLHVCQFLQKENKEKRSLSTKTLEYKSKEIDQEYGDKYFKSIMGQKEAKLAALVALAGRHHLCLSGAPGVGKSMLAKAMGEMMLPLSGAQMIDCALLHSWHGQDHLCERPPIRRPHHNLTQSALCGGGMPLVPGELSLAHHGMLFLDELTEFSQQLLDLMRQPLVDGVIHLSRQAKKVVLPCKFLLVATMNPCPCGYYGIFDRCQCGYMELQRYQKKISGPLLDRIDILVHMKPEGAVVRDLKKRGGLKTKSKPYFFLDDGFDIMGHLQKVRAVQMKRQGCLNSELTWKKLQEIMGEGKQFQVNAGQIGMRSMLKNHQVALTLTDLHGKKFEKKYLDQAVCWSGHRVKKPFSDESDGIKNFDWGH